ncbi:hypothetical protein [Pseudomonas fluorescens]|uniref:O-antigen polymerase n=1 Tax=Pseudomonas fluorescens TaxID=294 RepID=A0A5E7E5P9_PSEFL|nr:hypothetical protein [Pseudomonas fluorescens]VVO22011.1 hypothetical protein PS833_04285 [Pseudomonas fluorescens]
MYNQIENSKAPKLGILSVYLLWIACLFDPIGQIYHIKFIAIGLVYVVLGVTVALESARMRIDIFYIFSLVLFVLYLPGYGLLLAVLRGGVPGEFIDTSYISASVYMVCSLLYLAPGYMWWAYRALVVSLRLLCVVILVSFLFTAVDIFTDFVFFFVENGVAYIGEREYAGVSFYYIYFIASPMLVFLLCHETWKMLERPSLKSCVALLLPVFALFLSGTRASIILSFCAPFFVWMWYRFGRGAIVLVFCTIVLAMTALLFIDVPIISEMFGAREQSNATKIGYLSSYSEIFASPLTVLFGQGFNAHVWSPVLQNMLPEGASKTELTYIELLRVFGLFGSGMLAFLLAYLSLSGKVARSSYPWIAPSIFLYSAVSAINPYIFSSNGMLLIGFATAAIAFTPPGAIGDSLQDNSGDGTIVPNRL